MPNQATRFSLTGGDVGQLTGLADAMLAVNSIADLRELAPLPLYAQELIDKAVIQVGLDRLVIAQDIMAEGLVYTLPDPLSVMELVWEKESKIGAAKRTMLPGARGERQMPARSTVRIPVYATTEEFSLNIRTIRAAERAGAPLDTSMVSQATRRVNEAIEDAMINGAGLNVAGNSAPGLLNAPNANTYAYTGNEAWDVAGHTGEEILTDVLGMIDELQADHKYGPYNLYIPTTYGNKLNEDFKANSDKTIRQRLEELDAGGRPLRIRVADQLPANRTVLMQMTNDVADMVVGQQPVPVSWTDGPGWERMFVILAFMIPRVKDDYEGQSGICLGNTT